MRARRVLSKIATMKKKPFLIVSKIEPGDYEITHDTGPVHGASGKPVLRRQMIVWRGSQEEMQAKFPADAHTTQGGGLGAFAIIPGTEPVPHFEAVICWNDPNGERNLSWPHGEKAPVA